jgi:hypothetical protein
MDVMIVKNNKIKKIRRSTSFLIIKFSINLIIYSITSDEPKTLSISILKLAKKGNEEIYE